MVERRLGDSCRDVPTDVCRPPEKHADAIAAAYGTFTLPSPGATDEVQAEATEQFCTRGEKLIRELTEAPFQMGAYEAVIAQLSAVRQDGDDGGASSLLHERIEARQADVLRALDPTDRPFIARRAAVEAAYAEELFSIYRACAFAPTGRAEGLRRLKAWRTEDAQRAEVRRKHQLRVQQAQRTNPRSPLQRVVGFIQLHLWPFLLTAALALKFGKATTAIKDDIAGPRGVVRGWLGRITHLRPRKRAKPPESKSAPET